MRCVCHHVCDRRGSRAAAGWRYIEWDSFGRNVSIGFLLQKSATETAALQLYKMSTSNGKVRGKYAHKYGVAKMKVDFEYMYLLQ